MLTLIINSRQAILADASEFSLLQGLRKQARIKHLHTIISLYQSLLHKQEADMKTKQNLRMFRP